MKNLYVTDLTKNLLIVNETFAIADLSKGEDKNGKPYMNITLSDKTGKISGKIWSDTLAKINTNSIQSGIIVRISARVEDYKGRIQLNITDIGQVDETKLDDYMEASEFDPEDMMKELMSEVDSITHKGLKTVLKKMFADEEFLKTFKYRAAGRSIHHDFRSGMLQHVLEMLSIANSLKRFYSMVNFDILKAGVILHDVGKFEELDTDGIGTNYTKKGSLLGHITIGVMIFERYGGKDLPEDVYLHICHLILSHHGETQFGSPVTPATVEAIMLTYIDRLSSKARTAVKAVKEIQSDKDFGNPNMWLENSRFWKGGKYDDNSDNSEIDTKQDQLGF